MLCLTLPVIQRNLRMVEINKYYYYYYYYLGNLHHPDNYDSFSGNNLEHISVSHNIYK